MALTKRTMALLTIVLTIAYFVAFLYLPVSGFIERHDNMILFAPKILFLAVIAALVTCFVLILIFKREFISAQLNSYNRYKGYLKLLVRRDFITRYRKSILGVLWSLLNPLLTMLVLTMVFSTLFKIEIEYFPVYLLSGQFIFNFFSEATTMAMGSVLAAEGVIKKIYIPKYIFPLSKVLLSLVNMGFSFLAFLLVFIFTGVPFNWTVLLIPIPVLYTFVFALGVAMLLSSLAVFFRDLMYLYGVLLTLWMFMTPIMYPVSILPDWLIPYYGFNPLYHLVDYFRSVAMLGIVPDLWSNLVCISFALASLCLGTYVFMQKQDRYILYM
ncbi:MAG: ABC transporter permease [Oscillospiraceae bacterium]|nr:ABC transporter permease [Oscillospiraceae bacterium]